MLPAVFACFVRVHHTLYCPTNQAMAGLPQPTRVAERRVPASWGGRDDRHRQLSSQLFRTTIVRHLSLVLQKIIWFSKLPRYSNVYWYGCQDLSDTHERGTSPVFPHDG